MKDFKELMQEVLDQIEEAECWIGSTSPATTNLKKAEELIREVVRLSLLGEEENE